MWKERHRGGARGVRHLALVVELFFEAPRRATPASAAAAGAARCGARSGARRHRLRLLQRAHTLRGVNRSSFLPEVISVVITQIMTHFSVSHYFSMRPCTALGSNPKIERMYIFRVWRQYCTTVCTEVRRVRCCLKSRSVSQLESTTVLYHRRANERMRAQIVLHVQRL